MLHKLFFVHVLGFGGSTFSCLDLFIVPRYGLVPCNGRAFSVILQSCCSLFIFLSEGHCRLLFGGCCFQSGCITLGSKLLGFLGSLVSSVSLSLLPSRGNRGFGSSLIFSSAELGDR